MNRSLICAAAAAAFFALSAPVPAQAHMRDPGLNTAAPSALVDVQYRRDRHDWRHRHHYRRHRQCWNQRLRVRVRHGHFVFRTVRHCGWRGW